MIYPFRIGQKVRYYDMRFDGSVIRDFFKEGTIESIDEMFPYLYNVRLDRVVCNSRDIPHSWAIGTLGQFDAGYSYAVEILYQSPTQQADGVDAEQTAGPVDLLPGFMVVE